MRASGAAVSALAGTAIVAASSAGLANPKGGLVNAGVATIQNTSPTQLDIVQKTNRAVIDWQSFDIAVGERTNFQQPSAASMTLNRVHAADPSTIAGQLNANGSLVLINPNGVVFSRGSQVNVNSLIATPTDISNANFMAGKMRFDRPSSNPNARVINEGTITVAQKGLAALVAPGVANSGVIQANLGHVVLAGAETFTIDFYGDGLINFDIGSKVAAVPRDANGMPLTSLVSNTGTINAPGGTVLLTAEAAAGILANVIDASGRINAPTVAEARGSVAIDAGPGNAARLAGTIDVSASAATQSGGTATLTGGGVTVAGTARIDAHGPAGGGTVKIGGGAHGADAGVRNARNTSVNAGAIIDASATDSGNGGTVAVWSDGSTVFNGTIYARGGPNGGNGGWVETSGHSLSIANGAIVDASARAPGRIPGVWLLDPTDLTVSAPSDFNVTPPPVITPVTSPATVSSTTIQNALNLNTNVILNTTGSPNSGAETGAITVNAPVAWTTATTLTLNAAGNIQINSPITGSNPGSILALNAAGTVSQSVPGTITVGTLTGTSTGGTTLTSANSVDTLGSFSNNVSGGFTFTNNKPLTVTGPISGGPGVDSFGAPITSVQIETTGPASTLTIAGVITGSNSNGFGTPYAVELHATGAITETSTGSISAGSLLARTQNDAGAPIVLDNPANAIPGSVTLSTLDTAPPFSTPVSTAPAPGAITFVDSTGFTINSAPGGGFAGLELGITTTGTATLQAAGTIDQNGEVGFINAQNLVVRTLSDSGANIFLDTAANTVPGNVTLTALNAAGTALAPGSIAFFSAAGFTIASIGGLETGVATTADATLTSAGSIIEAAGAAITADLLSVTSVGGATLDGPNNVVTLDALNGGLGLFSFTNNGPLTVSSASSAGDLTLTTTGGSGSTLTLDGDVTGSLLTLNSSGPISQTAGFIAATTLTGSAGGAVSLAQSNLITFLDGFSTTTGGANGDFTLTNVLDLTVSNPVSTGSGTLTLNTGFSGLTLAAPFSPSSGGALLSTGTINLTADTMALNAQVGGSAPGVGSAAQVNIFPFSVAQPISLGTGAAIGLALDASELNNIRAAGVTIGNGTSGPLTFGAFTAASDFATTLLTLTTGSTATFEGALVLNGGLSVSASAGIDLNGGSITTEGPQTYNNPVLLTADTVLTAQFGGDITFVSTVDGAFALTVNTTGITAFDGPVGGVIALASLTTDAPGTTDLNGGVVNTIGTQTYNDPVLLTADTVLTSQFGGNITFASTVDGAFALTVNTAGVTAFNGAVGGATALASLATDAPGTTDLNGGIVNTIGSQFYGDPVLLTANTALTSLSGGDITFASTVDGAFALTVNTGGVTAFNGAVGCAIALASLTTDAPGETDLNGGVVNTAGPQTYSDPVLLTADTVLTSLSAGDITFASTVDGPFALFVNTAGITAFKGPVGGAIALASLTTDAPGTTDLNGGVVNTFGPQTYNDPVLLTADTALTSLFDGDITFASTVDGAFALTVNTGGVTAFNGTVGGVTALASLTTDVPGETDLNGGVVNTIGPQTYNDPVFLTADTILTSQFGGNITFASTVDGTFALTVNTAGVTAFFGPVGGAIALASLTTDAPGETDLNGGVVSTIGPQTYNDPVFLTTDTVLISQLGGDITFGNTVDSGFALTAFALTVNTAGITAFNGPVGGAIALASLTTDAPGTTDLNGGVVNTIGPQTYNDPVRLTANTVLLSQFGGDITFTNTVDGAFALTVNTAGTAAFGGAVGGAAPLASLDAIGGAIADNAPITMIGALTLNSTSSSLSLAQNLTADTVTLIATGPIDQTAGSIAAATLTGSSIGGATLTGTNQLVTLASFTNTGSGALTIANNRSLTTTGPLSSAGDVTLTTSVGTLMIGSDITAASGDVTLKTLAGPLSLTGSIGVSAGRDISITAGGAIEILGPTSTLSLSLSAGRDILLTSGFGPQNSGGVSLGGTIAMKAGEPDIVIAADGPFQQSGTLNVLAADYVMIDTTGTTAQQRLADLTQAIAAAGVQNTPNAVVITNPVFNPTGASANPITFAGTLNAPDSVLLVIANQGPITGGSSANPAIVVGGLGVSGAGSQAQLFGSVAGNSAQSAANSAVINPLTDPAYLLNGCIIGSVACAVPTPPEPPPAPPSLVVIDSLLLTQGAILVSIPSDTADALLRPQPASEVDILVARPAEDDPDTPLINIFDEERLCELLLRTNPELAREVCR